MWAAGAAISTLDTGHATTMQCCSIRGTRFKSSVNKHLNLHPCKTVTTFSVQALPIFLDKLLSPVLSVVLSVTAVLTVGAMLGTDMPCTH